MIKIDSKIKNEAGVYKLTNKLNNKIYIGSSVNVRKRIASHFRKGSKSCFFNIGLENTIIEVIEYTKETNRLTEKELFWMIEENIKFNMFYNKANPVTRSHLDYDYLQNAYFFKKFNINI